MPSGGARPRSGPPPDPRSGRSDARGISLELRANPRRGHYQPATPGNAPYGKRFGGFPRLWRGLKKNGGG